MHGNTNFQESAALSRLCCASLWVLVFLRSQACAWCGICAGLSPLSSPSLADLYSFCNPDVQFPQRPYSIYHKAITDWHSFATIPHVTAPWSHELILKVNLLVQKTFFLLTAAVGRFLFFSIAVSSIFVQIYILPQHIFQSYSCQWGSSLSFIRSYRTCAWKLQATCA